jgi:hypothetical protein
MPMKKGDNLTLKQRKWMKVYIQCGNATEAAMQVYNCKDRNSAKQIGFENLAKLNYTEFLEEGGITDELLRKKIEEGMDANRVISAVNTGKQATGATADFIDVPDFAIRHKYLETALKLKKRLDNKFELPNDISEMEIKFKRSS